MKIMKLKHITFTGVDEKTNINELKEIQKKYPLAEFGILTSYHWYDNGNRYLNPELIKNIDRKRELNLSLHLCGSAAHDASVKEWEKIDELVFDCLDVFKRVQLNLSERSDNPDFCWIPLVIGQELIVQQKSSDIDLFTSTLDKWKFGTFHHIDNISVLLDDSGGRGIDSDIHVLKGNYKVGYAGGIKPDNVEGKLSYLLENKDVGDFWIDMESGVRTDDWFDTNKVVDVLEKCYKYINNIK